MVKYEFADKIMEAFNKTLDTSNTTEEKEESTMICDFKNQSRFGEVFLEFSEDLKNTTVG